MVFWSRLERLKRSKKRWLCILNDLSRLPTGPVNNADMFDETQDPTMAARDLVLVLPQPIDLKETLFVSTTTASGEELQLRLPEGLIYQIKAMDKERTIISKLLTHWYPISYLRTFTLTGFSRISKKLDSPTQSPEGPGTSALLTNPSANPMNPLPIEKVLLITEVVRKCMPPTSAPDTDEGRKNTELQNQRVRGLITRVLQHFRDEYQEDGVLKPKLRNGKKRKNGQDSLTAD